MYNPFLFFVTMMILNFYVNSTKFISPDEITWSKYITSFTNLELNSSSYSNFRNNIDFINQNNKYYNFNLGVTRYFHVDRTEFLTNFLYSSKYYIKDGEYFLTSERGMFSKVKNGFYFDWNEKGLFSTFQERIYSNSLASQVSIYLLECLLKINGIISTTDNLSRNLNDITDIIEKQRKYEGDHFSSPIHYINYVISNGINVKTNLNENVVLESNRLIFKNKDFNIYDSPIVVELSLDPTYIQFYDGSVLHLNRISNQANYYALIVGYGKEKNEEYYIIKTSFDFTFKLRTSSTSILSSYTLSFLR